MLVRQNASTFCRQTKKNHHPQRLWQWSPFPHCVSARYQEAGVTAREWGLREPHRPHNTAILPLDQNVQSHFTQKVKPQKRSCMDTIIWTENLTGRKYSSYLRVLLLIFQKALFFVRLDKLLKTSCNLALFYKDATIETTLEMNILSTYSLWLTKYNINDPKEKFLISTVRF